MSGEMNPDIIYTTEGHPEANGRQPQVGEMQWVLIFPLEDGRKLGVRIGRTGRAALRHMLLQEMRDEEGEDGYGRAEPDGNGGAAGTPGAGPPAG